METREEILEFINETIENEHGERLTEENLLLDSGIDSFGIAMVFLELDGKYNAFPKTKFNSLKFESLKVKDIIDMVQTKLTEDLA